MSDASEDLLRAFAEQTQPEAHAGLVFQQNGDGTNVLVHGHGNVVRIGAEQLVGVAPEDALERLLRKAAPWGRRWLLVCAVLACAFPLLRIWQAYQLAGAVGLGATDAWLRAHDPGFLLKGIAAAAACASLYVLVRLAWRLERR